MENRKDNYTYLKDQIKHSGFGNDLDFGLMEALKKGEEQFTLKAPIKEYKGKEATAVLHFEKANDKDIYYFNKVEVSLGDKSNTFNVYKAYVERDLNLYGSTNYVYSECLNMLEGRSALKIVYDAKEKTYKNLWVKLKLDAEKDKYGNYPREFFKAFDIKSKIANLPLANITDESRDKMIKRLAKGDVVIADYKSGEETYKVSFVATPEFKTIKMEIVDDRLQKVIENGPVERQDNVAAEQTPSETTLSGPQVPETIQKETEASVNTEPPPLENTPVTPDQLPGKTEAKEQHDPQNTLQEIQAGVKITTPTVAPVQDANPAKNAAKQSNSVAGEKKVSTAQASKSNTAVKKNNRQTKRSRMKM
uniref:hypothetical protein n=1 Tax=Pedobacter schmidteae TaxID=2201271 RepID=UPI000EAD22EA|nr:hypothetical protein [Pedobacter schmidteae]